MFYSTNCLPTRGAHRIEHGTVKALHTLYAKLAALRTISPVDLLLSGNSQPYESTLEEAYAALASIETELDELGEALEYQHARISGVIEQA